MDKIKLTRRNFLLGSTLAAGGALLGASPLAAATVAAPAAAPIAKPTGMGKVYGFGMFGHLFPGHVTDAKKTSSVVTTLDLDNGTIKQTSLAMGEGHAAMAAGDGRILCTSHHNTKSMMIDADHKVQATFVAPQGYVYGGHSLVFKERNQFIMPMRASKPKTDKDHGRMEVYDLTTLKLVDTVDSGGLHPHEIHKIPGTDELVTTHYGDIYVNQAPLEHNVLEPKLTVMDAKTYKPKRDYMEKEFKAMVTHMRVDKHGWAYFVLQQYMDFDEIAKLYPGLDPQTAAIGEVKKIFNIDWDFPVPYQTMQEKHLAIPLPFVRVNTQTGERQVINAGNQYHLRSQSVAYNQATDTAIALFHHSDALVLSSPGKQPEVITNDQLDLTEIRGIAEIPGTTLIVVCGTYRGVSVMDLTTRKVVAHFPTLNYNSTHLYHEADI